MKIYDDNNNEIPLDIFIQSLKELQPYIQEEIHNEIIEKLKKLDNETHL